MKKLGLFLISFVVAFMSVVPMTVVDTKAAVPEKAVICRNESTGNNTDRVLILINGLNTTGIYTNWDNIKSKFDRFYERIVFFSYDPSYPTGSYSKADTGKGLYANHIPALKSLLRKCKEDFANSNLNIKSFDLMGHSQGGVTSFYFAKENLLGGEFVNDVKNIITLDAPINGSQKLCLYNFLALGCPNSIPQSLDGPQGNLSDGIIEAIFTGILGKSQSGKDMGSLYLGTEVRTNNGLFVKNIKQQKNIEIFTFTNSEDMAVDASEATVGVSNHLAIENLGRTNQYGHGDIFTHYGALMVYERVKNIIENDIGNPGCTSDCGVTPPPGDLPPDPQGNNAAFVSDITIPDGTEMGPNSSFVKTWRVKNVGSTTWNTGYKLQYQSGNKMGAPNSVNLPGNVSPGQSVNISVNMVSPSAAGSYRGYWTLANSGGSSFGDVLWADIKVKTSSPPITTTGEVKLYSQSNYNNEIGSYGQGTNNDPSANSYSMKITPGWSVKTFRNDGQNGDSRCWYESVPNLQDHGWHNAIQSIQVFNYNACTSGQKVKLFGLSGYRELKYELDPTSTGNNAPNRDTYSMEIPNGWSVRTYDQDNSTGRSRCWNSSVSNLQDHESWHNAIDSIKIYTSNECSPGQASWFVKICRQTGAHAGTDCHTVDRDIPSLGAGNSMGNYSFGNDAVKSIWIDGQWEAALFQHDNYQGQRNNYGDNNNDIRGYPPGPGPDNEYGTSSIKVRKFTDGIVKIHRLQNLGSGDPLVTDNSLDDFEHWNFNDKAESISVAGGYEALLCQEGGYRGYCARFKDTTNNLAVNHPLLNHGASSVRVCQGACDLPPTVDPVEPTNNVSFVPGTNVKFYWSGAGKEFQFEITGGALGSTINQGWTTSNNTTVNSLAKSNNPYRWRVRSWNEFGEGPWSSYQDFYIKEIAPVEGFIVANDEALINTDFDAYAFVNPNDTTNLSYNWSPAPKSGQGTPFATYAAGSSVSSKQISLSVSNSSGNVSTNKTVQIIKEDEPDPVCDNIFCGEYFNNMDVIGTPVYKNKTNSINYEWGSASPGPGVNADGFSARWTGKYNFTAGQYKFDTFSDDGDRVWIDGQLKIDNWINGHTLGAEATVNLSAGVHEIRVEFVEGTGHATMKLNWAKVGGGEPDPCLNVYCAQYFNNPNLTGTPVKTNKTGKINYTNWGLSSPLPGIQKDRFSVRWEGKVQFSTTGNYRFAITADDGMRVWVDGQLRMDYWKGNGLKKAAKKIYLTSGQHTIKVEYVDRIGSAKAVLNLIQI